MRLMKMSLRSTRRKQNENCYKRYTGPYADVETDVGIQRMETGKYDERNGFINLYHPEYNILITVCMIGMTVGIVYPGMKTVWKKGVTDFEMENILSNPMLYA